MTKTKRDTGGDWSALQIRDAVQADIRTFLDHLRSDLSPAITGLNRIESQMRNTGLSWDDVGDHFTPRRLLEELSDIRREQRNIALERMSEQKNLLNLVGPIDAESPRAPETVLQRYISQNPPPADLYHKRKYASGKRLSLESDQWLKKLLLEQPYFKKIGARALHKALTTAGFAISLAPINDRMHN